MAQIISTWRKKERRKHGDEDEESSLAIVEANPTHMLNSVIAAMVDSKIHQVKGGVHEGPPMATEETTRLEREGLVPPEGEDDDMDDNASEIELNLENLSNLIASKSQGEQSAITQRDKSAYGKAKGKGKGKGNSAKATSKVGKGCSQQTKGKAKGEGKSANAKGKDKGKSKGKSKAKGNDLGKDRSSGKKVKGGKSAQYKRLPPKPKGKGKGKKGQWLGGGMSPNAGEE